METEGGLILMHGVEGTKKGLQAIEMGVFQKVKGRDKG